MYKRNKEFFMFCNTISDRFGNFHFICNILRNEENAGIQGFHKIFVKFDTWFVVNES